MKNLIIVALALVCGCTTKTRNVELDGMFTQVDAGMLAIGSVDVMGTPVGEESAIIKYAEDNAWLQPSMKLHSIRILLTGTNSAANVTSVVESICGAFVGKHIDNPTEEDAKWTRKVRKDAENAEKHDQKNFENWLKDTVKAHDKSSEAMHPFYDDLLFFATNREPRSATGR